MPAALPAATPAMASSKTRQLRGSAGGENAAAAVRKMSGAGLPFVTWSPAAGVIQQIREQPHAAMHCLSAAQQRFNSTCYAVVKQREELGVPPGLQLVVPLVRGCRQAEGQAPRVQVAQQALSTCSVFELI